MDFGCELKPANLSGKTETRVRVLEEAVAVDKQRGEQYGGKERNFEAIAEMWSNYLDTEVTPHDVCLMMALLKIQRAKTGKFHLDNYIDGANYIALAAEMEEVK